MTTRRSRDPFEPERPKRRRRSVERDPQQPGDDATRSAPKRGKAKFVLLGIVAIVLLLPNFVGWLGLQKHAIKYALSDFQGHVNVGQFSTGWFQSISLGDVEVTDLAGKPILTLAKLKTQKPLYSFLFGSDYGEIDVHQPSIFLHLRENGSNVEDALSHYMAASQPSPMQNSDGQASTFLPKALVRVHDGRAVLTSDSDSRAWQVDSLAASVELSSQRSPLAATVQFHTTSLQPDSGGQLKEESGNVLLSSAFDVGSDRLAFETANIKLESQSFPLSIVAPLCERFIGPSTISGSATAKLDASWNSQSHEIVADVEMLQADNTSVYAPGLYIDDNFFLQQLSARGLVQLSTSRMKAEQFVIATDFGTIDANGQFNPAQLASLSAANRLPDSDLNVEGYLDLAALMQRLPKTFQLHEDIAIESGTLRFSAGQSNDADARRLILNLDTANIRARRGDQPIVWQQPLRLVGTLRESGGQFAIENLECMSDFLTITGSATLQEGVFTADGDLSKLSRRISQFADLGQFHFGGTLKGQFGWQVADPEQGSAGGIVDAPVQVGGEFTVTQPEIQFPDLPPWSPQQVVIRTSGSGRLISDSGASQQLSLQQAGAQLVIDNESSIVSLARPVNDAFTNEQWVFNTQVNGQVEGWLQHLRNFVDPGEFDASGALNFAGVAIIDSGSMRIENGQYEVKQLRFDGYGATVREDRVVGEVTAGYSMSQSRVDVARATLQGSGLSATVGDLNLMLADAMFIDGQVAWRADINRVAEWLSLSTQPDSVYWYGAAEGTANFKSGNNGTDADFQADLSDLVAAQRASADPQQPGVRLVSNPQNGWVELWREGVVKLSGRMNISSDFDRLTFEGLSARSQSLDVDAKGTISDLAGTLDTNLEGNYRPDFQEVNALLAAYTQGAMQLEGNGTHPFRIQGPMFSQTPSDAWVPPGLTVEALASWERGNLLGLPIGKSDVRLDLRQQVAAVDAQQLPVSGGFANLAPRLDMRDGPPVLIHGESKVLDNVKVTPEICNSCLQYVAPWMAGAANAQGTFSADLQGMRMPIADPMEVSARASLHVKELTIDAGPLAQELLGTLTLVRSLLKPDARERQVEKWLRVERQTIPVAIENRRVYHEGVKFSHDELVIRTSGSVGIEDQSLNMVANIPIADEWIEDNRYLSGLKGQSLSIPIGGTVAKPYIDPNRVNQLSRELVQNATQAALGNAINEKVNPKLNEFNQKLTGEVDKLQNRFNEKLGGFLNDKLGVPSGSGGAPAGSTSPQPSGRGQIEDRINDGLKKGLDKLFGGN